LIGFIPAILFEHFDKRPAINMCINTHYGRVCQIHLGKNGYKLHDYGRAKSCGLVTFRPISTKGIRIRVFLATFKPKVIAKQILDRFNLTPFFNDV
jgi:hypothetical protein